MQKILAILFSFIIVAGLAVGGYFLVINIKNEQNHTINISASEGGKVTVLINEDEHSVSANSNANYKVTAKDKVKLTATANAGYEFSSWTRSGNSYSNESSIEIKVTKDVEFKANFTPHTITASISGDIEDTTIELTLDSGLLDQLNNKFTAPFGYKYIYSFGNNVISNDTTITDDMTISARKEIVTYSITFKNGDEVIGEDSYTIEDKEISIPEVPTAIGYTTSWEAYDLDSLGDKTVNVVKTLNIYTVTFMNGDEEVAVEEYSIENLSVTEPTIETEDHYTKRWSVYDLNTLENIVSTLERFATPYTVSFKNGDEIIDTRTYTIENKSITVPEVPALEHYTDLSWGEYDLETLTNIDVQLNKTPIEYNITLVVPAGFIHEEEQVVEKTYNIESTIEDILAEAQDISTSLVPGYAISWPEIELTYNNEPLVITAERSIIEYTIDFVLPGEYKFEDETNSVQMTYTVENLSTIVPPTLPTIEKDYHLDWGTLDFTTLENKVITATRKATEYKANFLNVDGTTYATRTFTVENPSFEIVATPASLDGYTYKWASYSIDTTNMSDINIQLIKLGQITVIYEDGIYNIPSSVVKYSRIFVVINADGTVAKDGDNVIIYEVSRDNSNIIQVIEDFAKKVNEETVYNASNNSVPVVRINETPIENNFTTVLNNTLSTCTGATNTVTFYY